MSEVNGQGEGEGEGEGDRFGNAARQLAIFSRQ
jgi:hypothetical protein